MYCKSIADIRFICQKDTIIAMNITLYYIFCMGLEQIIIYFMAESMI